MPDTEQALNEAAESPIAANNTSQDRETILNAIANDSAEDDAQDFVNPRESTDDTTLNAGQSDANQTQSQNREDIEPAATLAPKHQEAIPYDRFREVNERAQSLAPLEPWKVAVERLQQFGYTDPVQLVQQLEAQEQAARQQVLARQIDAEYQQKADFLGEEAANAWREAKVEALQAQELVRQAQGQHYINHVNAQWDSIKDSLPAAVHTAARDMLMQSSPQYLPTVVKTLTDIATQAADAAKVAYATDKTRDGKGAVAVARGGSPAQSGASAQKNDDSWKRSSFTQLMASGGRTG